MKYVPQPLFSEEEVSHAICCRNIFIKGCEVCREQHSLKSPGCLGSWSGRRTHPHTGCPAQAQTQMCEWSRIPPRHICASSGLPLFYSCLAPPSSKSARLRASESALLSDLSYCTIFLFLWSIWHICLELK